MSSTTNRNTAVDDFPAPLPDVLVTALSERFDDAHEWSAGASRELLTAANALGLEFRRWHPGAKRSLVGLFATDSGVQIVGKACAVNHQATADMLRLYARLGVGPNVVHADARTLFMAHVPDAEPLDHSSFTSNVDVVRELLFSSSRVQPPASLPTLRDRFDERIADARRRAWALPYGEGIVEVIVGAVDKLCVSDAAPFACHGNTAPRNILVSHGELWLVDPEPHIGFVEIDAVKLLDALGVPVIEGVRALGLDTDLAEAYLPIQRGTAELYEATKARRS